MTLDTNLYILNERGEPTAADVLTWAQWLERYTDAVGDDEVGGVRVSTRFIGVPHPRTEGPPRLWETLVFGGDMDGSGQRYSSHAEALNGHARMVYAVRRLQRMNEGPK